MGCGHSSPTKEAVSPVHSKASTLNAIKAAVLIQKWYRRYQARLEARKRCTWNIFQSIEYAGEQDQLKLYNFFNNMLGQMGDNPESSSNVISLLTSAGQVTDDSDQEKRLLDLTNPCNIKVESSYKGPELAFPLTTGHLESLISGFKHKQILHSHYLIQLLVETRKLLKGMGNISYVSTSMSKQITICGDLHGKLDDLFVIFYKNGLPAGGNPYIFNGDFVDRGNNSVEVACVLFTCLLVHPNDVYLNRGNHEDHIMNLRYGFIKEVMCKYKVHAPKIIRLFTDVFSWLPLATIIDHKIFITHGGISDKTSLEMLKKIDRHKYLSALKPPVKEGCSENDYDRVDTAEWRQMLDILWSDPKNMLGCQANNFRGGGCYFGPDVTDKILRKHGWKLLIRSHECKPEGYEFMHGKQVLTVFSASNYYELGSNKGAYIKMGPDLKPHCVQFMATKQSRKVTPSQRINLIEESAIRDLREKIFAMQTTLLEDFKSHDVDDTGCITTTEWCNIMSKTLCLELPWRHLRTKLAKVNSEGLVVYKTTFENFKLQYKNEAGGRSLTETLYRNRDNLGTIFRAIDKDNSGLISMDEFSDACHLLSKHVKTDITQDYINDLARSIDINKDGFIDFNEFLEAFRLVDVVKDNMNGEANKNNQIFKLQEEQPNVKSRTSEEDIQQKENIV